MQLSLKRASQHNQLNLLASNVTFVNYRKIKLARERSLWLGRTVEIETGTASRGRLKERRNEIGSLIGK